MPTTSVAPQIFPNSIQHRRRIRLWMSLLCSFPMLSGPDFSLRLPRLWKAIDNESIPSTRAYIEWFIILGVVKFRQPADLNNLLARLLEFSQPTGTVISLLTITMHVGLKLSSLEDYQSEHELFFRLVFDRLLPWFLHHNHMVRLFALFVFNRLWTIEQQSEAKSNLKTLEGFSNMAAFITQSDNSQRFLAKLDKEYFLSRFDPIRDFNLQCIFTTLPENSDIASNELISPYSFINIVGSEEAGNALTIPPFDQEQFDNSTISMAITSVADNLNESPTSVAASTAMASFYQQKIDPWDMELLDRDLDDIKRQREVLRKKGNSFDMVMVASLIDRIPNLAGLSRTCEILGAAGLVMPSLAVLDNPHFQNISMTSEKWLDIAECKAGDLASFLQTKRMEDYKIIAIEQSSQSHSLLYYEFPPKCCLVLGNENTGVPAEILHLVDDCLEIPQFGIIRSLNVHVSGSLVLWEARRQFLLKKDTID